MTDFEKKRLEYFIKAANENGWVHLGKGDVDLFENLKQSHNFGFDEGFKEGIEYVVSGEMAFDEQKEEALKGIY